MKWSWLAMTAALVLGGCVVVSEQPSRGGPADSSPGVVRAAQLAGLEMGLEYGAVLERLGPPRASAARMSDGSECRYLTYATRNDGKDEVQLVFEDKRLIGWGKALPRCPR